MTDTERLDAIIREVQGKIGHGWWWHAMHVLHSPPYPADPRAIIDMALEMGKPLPARGGGLTLAGLPVVIDPAMAPNTWRIVPAPRLARTQALDWGVNSVYRYATTPEGDKGKCYELDLPPLPTDEMREGGSV